MEIQYHGQIDALGAISEHFTVRLPDNKLAVDVYVNPIDASDVHSLANFITFTVSKETGTVLQPNSVIESLPLNWKM